MSALTTPDIWSVILRAASFVLLLNSAGIVIFLVLFGRSLSESSSAVYRLGSILTLASIGFVAGQFALEAGRMAGEMGGVIDPSMQMMALHSPTGAAFAVRMLGLVLVAVGLRAGGGLRTAVMGALLAVLSFSLAGHTSVSPYRLLVAAVLVSHLLTVAFWIGALGPLYMVTSREPLAAAVRLIDSFSTIAVWAVPGIALAGIGLTAALVPELAVFSRPYGRLLLAKVLLYAVLLGLGALNKWIIVPDMAGGELDSAGTFRRTVAVEYVLIAMVLAVTAAMTTFYSPAAS